MNLLLKKNSNRKQANFAVMEAFPHRIAAALLSGRQIETISKPSVSLLFSDIVGFTRACTAVRRRTPAFTPDLHPDACFYT